MVTHTILVASHCYSVCSVTRLLLARWCVELASDDLKILLARELHFFTQFTDRFSARLTELSAACPVWTFVPEILEREVACDSSPSAVVRYYESFLPLWDSSLVKELGFLEKTSDEPTRVLLEDVIRKTSDPQNHIILRTAKAETCSAPARETLLNLEWSDILLRPLNHTSEQFANPATSNHTVIPSSSKEYAIYLMHTNFTDLEIATIEACSRAIIEFPAMPEDFRKDMARQCWDEARHATLFQSFLKGFGGDVGMFPRSHIMWQMASGQRLEVRLAIHQKLGEWIGVDGALFHSALFRESFPSLASALEFIARDEITHVAFGNKWIRHISGGNPNPHVNREAERLREKFGKLNGGPLVFPFNRWACEAAGFSQIEISAFEARYAEHGCRHILPELINGTIAE